MSIGGVLVAQLSGRWFKTLQWWLIHRLVLTGKVGRAQVCLQWLGGDKNTTKDAT